MIDQMGVKTPKKGADCDIAERVFIIFYLNG